MKRKQLKVDGILDIETEEWDSFVCGCLYRSDGTYTLLWWEQEEELVDELLAMEGQVYGHNAGRYDGLWGLSHVASRRLRAEIACAGQRIVSIKVRKLRLLDSAALIPLPLREAAQIGAFPKLETGLRCRCGRGCGGYCSIRRRGMTKAEKAATEKYLLHDCKSLFSTLETLGEFCTTHDIDLGITIGSSAWRTALRWGQDEGLQ